MPIRPVSQWGIVDFIIAVIVIAACVGILYVAMDVMGVAIPAWAIHILWIVLVAVVAIIAIRFLVTLLSGPPGP
jgi:hypothetical protein